MRRAAEPASVVLWHGGPSTLVRKLIVEDQCTQLLLGFFRPVHPWVHFRQFHVNEPSYTEILRAAEHAGQELNECSRGAQRSDEH
jgi:hypothetical protein